MNEYLHYTHRKASSWNRYDGVSGGSFFKFYLLFNWLAVKFLHIQKLSLFFLYEHLDFFCNTDFKQAFSPKLKKYYLYAYKTINIFAVNLETQ